MKRLFDVLLFVGSLAAISVGCWWLLPAAGLIIPGVIVLGVVLYCWVK